MEITELPYGSWPTPITADMVVRGGARITDVRADGEAAIWSEERPDESGRTQLVAGDMNGNTTDLLPDEANVRTAVHEYGRASWYVRDGIVWYANWSDQRLYRLDPGGTPVAITPEPAQHRGDRYADFDSSPDGGSLVGIREHHPRGGRGAADVRNEIVRLAAHRLSEPKVLVTGPDFVAAPRLSPDGGALCWIQWNHPAMPWDTTELVVRDLSSGHETVVAGGADESVQQPSWQPDGSLWFVSDRTGWWNLYRWDGVAVAPLVETAAELGEAAVHLGSARYAVLASGEVVFARWSAGYDGLAVRGKNGVITDLGLPFSAVGKVRTAGDDAVFVVAGTPTAEPGVYRVEVPGGALTTLRPPRELGLAPENLSVPETLDFPSAWPDGSAREAHALFYPPASASHRGQADTRPPLLVTVHGGPTSAAVPMLDLELQYWTSRGFAVVDVNYGGSTGYGRAYREQLRGSWGIIDVTDCLAVARHLAAQGRVDPERMCISGGSAGGYTVLAALVHEDTPFAAGANHFGVADLEKLTLATHKFESHYLDGLIGPYPQARAVYEDRSPIQHVSRFRSPLIVLQGAEDVVVPPAQSEMIVDALRAQRIPVAYLLFDDEQHGFRRSQNIRRALEAELSFYSQVLGFALPADERIEPVRVENLA